MPTQEERLETVEYGLKQFKTETIKAYQEMALETTMVKGLSEDAVKRLMVLKTTTDQRFTSIDQQIGEMRQEIGEIRKDIKDLHTKSDEHTALLTQILARLPNP